MRLSFLHTLLFYFVFFLSISWCGDLQHYGIQKMNDPQLELRLQDRFKSKGKPLFLVHDVRQGISQGDFIRFSDKVILIDGEVLQTLQVEGVLKALSSSPLVVLKAKAKSDIWKSRANVVSNQKESYLFVGELLKVFEAYFGDIPSKEEIVLQFDGPQLTAIIPTQISSKLRFQKVKKEELGGQVKIVSKGLSEALQGQTIQWDLWAVDTQEPSQRIKYSIKGNLPRGLKWNSETHSLSGVADSVGTFKIRSFATNTSNITDSLVFDLVIKANQAPEILNPRQLEVVQGQKWSFKPLLRDAQDGYSRLNWKVDTTNISLITNQDEITWTNPGSDTSIQSPFFDLSAWDSSHDTSHFHFVLSLVKAEDLVHKKGFELYKPLDSFIVQHEYRFPIPQKMNASLTQVHNKDSSLSLFINALFPDSSAIVYRPKSPGLDTLQFIFTTEHGEISFYQEVRTVLNRSPIFTSSISSARGQLNTPFSYTPTVLDIDHDSTSIQLLYKDSGFIWDGHNLSHVSSLPGIYFAQFSVSDPYGTTSNQWIRWEVLKTEFLSPHLVYQYENFNDPLMPAHWDLRYEGAHGSRIGLFTPNFSSITPDKPQTIRYNPMLYVGTNFLDRDPMAQRLTLDLGLSLHSRSPKLLGGGFFTRFEGFYENSAFISQFKVQSYIRQALLIVTSNENTLLKLQQDIASQCDSNDQDCKIKLIEENPLIKEKCSDYFLDNYIDQNGQLQVPNRTLNAECEELFTQLGLGKGFHFLLSDYVDRNNAGILFQLETLYKLNSWCALGPFFSRRDLFLPHMSEQILGVSSLFHFEKWRQNISIQLKWGYGVSQDDQDKDGPQNIFNTQLLFVWRWRLSP